MRGVGAPPMPKNAGKARTLERRIPWQKLSDLQRRKAARV
jgi:hypothetical protein